MIERYLAKVSFSVNQRRDTVDRMRENGKLLEMTVMQLQEIACT